jgi:hypothetical protein
LLFTGGAPVISDDVFIRGIKRVAKPAPPMSNH